MPATNVISFLDAGRRRLAKQIATIEAELELGLLTMKVMTRLRTLPEMDGCTMSSSELYRFVQSELRAKLIIKKNRK
jgi:hypothetical protein